MPTTIVGILVAIVVAFGVMFLGGMDPIGIFFGDPMSAALVFVGTIAATFASMAMSDSIGGLKAGVSTMIKSPKADLSGTIASGFWTKASGFAPAFGVFGTVVGLIDMLKNLSDPSALGPALAVAFVTTLWGVFLANFLFQPIAFKMDRNAQIERSLRELQVEGILSIQRGMNPRSLSEKLTVFLPPSQRVAAVGEELKKSA